MNDITAIIISVVAIFIGVFFSALFSGLETGLYVLNKVRLSLRSSGGDVAAKRIEAALTRSGSMLASLLLGTNISHYVVTVSSVLLLERLGVSDVELVSTIVLTPLLFVFAEMVPKNLFRQAAENLTYFYSGILAATLKIFRWVGLSGVLDLISRGLLKLLTRNKALDTASALMPVSVRAYLAEARAHGTLSDTQQWMAHRVMELRGTKVADIMTPARQVVSVRSDCGAEQFVSALKTHSYSRIPIVDSTSGKVAGVVNVCKYLAAGSDDVKLADFTTEAVWISDSWEVSRALLQLQQSHRTIGMVSDSRGRFCGIVTLKDIVEEIVGELQAW